MRAVDFVRQGFSRHGRDCACRYCHNEQSEKLRLLTDHGAQMRVLAIHAARNNRSLDVRYAVDHPAVRS